MKKTWGKIMFCCLDVVLIIYIALSMTSFNKPLLGNKEICSKIEILVDDNVTESFLNSRDIKNILQNENLYVLGQPVANINTRRIEEVLLRNELIEAVLCYQSSDGKVFISVKQRTPIFHIKSINGEDYYLDANGCIIPHPQIPVNIVVATGYISKKYAQSKLTPLGNILTQDSYWNEETEQVHVLPNGDIELIPRSASHVIKLGRVSNIKNKLSRIRKFYQYGLNEIGWNKYSYINVEFDNQIVCKKVENKPE